MATPSRRDARLIECLLLLEKTGDVWSAVQLHPEFERDLSRYSEASKLLRLIRIERPTQQRQAAGRRLLLGALANAPLPEPAPSRALRRALAVVATLGLLAATAAGANAAGLDMPGPVRSVIDGVPQPVRDLFEGANKPGPVNDVLSGLHIVEKAQAVREPAEGPNPGIVPEVPQPATGPAGTPLGPQATQPASPAGGGAPAQSSGIGLGPPTTPPGQANQPPQGTGSNGIGLGPPTTPPGQANQPPQGNGNNGIGLGPPTTPPGQANQPPSGTGSNGIGLGPPTTPPGQANQPPQGTGSNGIGLGPPTTPPGQANQPPQGNGNGNSGNGPPASPPGQNGQAPQTGGGNGPPSSPPGQQR